MRLRMLLPLAMVASAVAVGCGSKPIIGVVLPQSGFASSYGSSIESGMRLAIDDARERGTLSADFQVFWADSASRPDQAASEFRRLVEEHDVRVIVGAATSAEATAVIPVAEELNIVCISPSASKPGLAAQSKMFYRIYPSDDQEGLVMARFIDDRLKPDKLLMLVGNQTYVEGIEPDFTEEYVDSRGGDVTQRLSIVDEGWEAGLRAYLAKNTPDVVLIVAFSGRTLQAIRILREFAYKGRIVTTSAFYTEDILGEAGDDAEGVFFPLPPFDRTSTTEPVEGFVRRYLEKFNRAPDVFAAHGYDAMNLAIQAVTLANPTETSEIEKVLRFPSSDTAGVTGAILFDDFGDVQHYHTMFVYFEGRVITYQNYRKIVMDRILEGVRDVFEQEQR